MVQVARVRPGIVSPYSDRTEDINLLPRYPYFEANVVKDLDIITYVPLQMLYKTIYATQIRSKIMGMPRCVYVAGMPGESAGAAT